MSPNLLAQRLAARRDLVARKVADLDAEGAAPEPGFVRPLSGLEGSITAVESVVEDS